MMERQVIHIGYSKTGTTWFQKSLYPKIKNFYFFNKTELRENIISPTRTNTKSFNINTNTIICFEDFTTLKQEHVNPEEKARRLKNQFENAEIIIFIRNQTEIIASAYSEYIKAGGTLNVSDYIEFLRTTNRLKHWKYINLIEYYTGLFGESKVNVFLYEGLKDEPDFISEYIKVLRFDVDIKKINFSKRNKKYVPFVLKIARITNHFSKRQLYTKHPDKKYFFHIPFWLFITHKFYYVLNFILMLYYNNKISAESILGQDLSRYIYTFYKDSNSNLSKIVDKNRLEYYKYL